MKRSLPQKRRLAKKPPRRLLLQQLEKRDLRAADIGFADGLLSVTGTENDDVIEAYVEDSQLIVNVSEYDASGQLLDEQLRTLNADEVQQILISTGDGDDVIVNDTDKRAIIRSGDGDDVIMAGDGGDVVSAGSGDDIVFGGAGNDVILGGSGGLASLQSIGGGDGQIPTEADLGLADFDPVENDAAADPIQDDLATASTEPDPLGVTDSEVNDEEEAVEDASLSEGADANLQEVEDLQGDSIGSESGGPVDLTDGGEGAESVESEFAAVSAEASEGDSLEAPEEESLAAPIEEPIACEPAEIPDPQQAGENQGAEPSSGLDSNDADEPNGDATDVPPEQNATESGPVIAQTNGSDDAMVPEDVVEDAIPTSDEELIATNEPEVADDDGSIGDVDAEVPSDVDAASSDDSTAFPEPEVAGDQNDDAGDGTVEPMIEESTGNEDGEVEPVVTPTAATATGSNDPSGVAEPGESEGASAEDVNANPQETGESDNEASYEPLTADIADDGQGDETPTAADADMPSGEAPLPSSALTDDDVIFGGSGNDWLFGGRGDDMIFGDGGIMTDDMLTDILMSRLEDPGDLSA